MATHRFHGNQYVYASGRRRPKRPAFTGNQYVDRNGKPRRQARRVSSEAAEEFEGPSGGGYGGGEAITYDEIDWDWDGLYDAIDADLDDTDDESYSGE